MTVGRPLYPCGWSSVDLPDVMILAGGNTGIIRRGLECWPPVSFKAAVLKDSLAFSGRRRKIRCDRSGHRGGCVGQEEQGLLSVAHGSDSRRVYARGNQAINR